MSEGGSGNTATSALTREALGVVILSIVVVLGIILLTAFKDVSTSTSATNAEVDKFIAGLGTFGDFIAIIVITVIVVGLLLLLILAIRKLRKGM